MSAVLLEDTRNPEGKHRNVHEWARAKGVTIIRTKLLVGDYTLPTDQSRCVDTKYGMQEVYSNLVQQHDRFRAECELAQKAGILLTVLVEEPGIEGLDGVKMSDSLQPHESPHARPPCPSPTPRVYPNSCP